MDFITVNKIELIEILKKNKAKHIEIFKEAYEEYRKETIEYLQESLRLAQGTGRVLSPEYEPDEPKCYVKSYDLAIQMLEMSVDDKVNLSEKDFRRYVRDEWEWTSDFYISNSCYSSSSSSSSSSVGMINDDIDAVFQYNS